VATTSARDVLTRDIIASYWAIAGNCFPGAPSEVSPFPIEDRLQAAAEHGYTGVGLVDHDLAAVDGQIGLKRLGDRLRELELPNVEVEILADWYATGERRRRSEAQRAELLRAAEALGARHMKIRGDLEGPPASLEETLEPFAQLCRQAAEVGTVVALEPIPSTTFPDLRSARALVEAAGEPNGKLCVDVWHVARAGTPYSEVAALPRELIAHVEIDDARAEVVDGLWTDTIHHRLLPGEGDLDVVAFLSALRETGYDGTLGVEVISRTHRKLPLGQAAEAAFRSAMVVLEQEARLGA
jgi:sugar phosphate isomerase/epimerase